MNDAHAPTPPRPRRRRGRWLVLAGMTLAIAVAVFLGPVAPWLGHRLVLPIRDQGRPYALLPEDSDYELVRLALPDGTPLVGQYGRARLPADAATAPTVLFLYGSSQTVAAPHNQSVFRTLRAMGANVFTVDFPGHGMSGGVPSEAGLEATASAALDHLERRTDLARDRIVVAGQSRGSGPAVALASRRRVAGLILVCPFTRGEDVVAGQLAWLPRVVARRLVARCPFDNLAKMPAVTCPTLIVSGGLDRICPPWMTAALAGASGGPVISRVIPASEHNSLWKSERFGLDREVAAWLREPRRD